MKNNSCLSSFAKHIYYNEVVKKASKTVGDYKDLIKIEGVRSGLSII